MGAVLAPHPLPRASSFGQGPDLRCTAEVIEDLGTDLRSLELSVTSYSGSPPLPL